MLGILRREAGRHHPLELFKVQNWNEPGRGLSLVRDVNVALEFVVKELNLLHPSDLKGVRFGRLFHLTIKLTLGHLEQFLVITWHIASWWRLQQDVGS